MTGAGGACCLVRLVLDSGRSEEVRRVTRPRTDMSASTTDKQNSLLNRIKRLH
jgi:hypothetical protein